MIKDLKSRGLFNDTLVVCGSEFGRTPVVEVGGMAAQQSGRDHNPFGFSMWLAGGGVKGGITYGATDDFGFKAVEKPVHVHDLHATILHLMGIDHTKLTYQLQRPRLPADRRVGQRAARHHRVRRGHRPQVFNPVQRRVSYPLTLHGCDSHERCRGPVPQRPTSPHLRKGPTCWR